MSPGDNWPGLIPHNRRLTELTSVLGLDANAILNKELNWLITLTVIPSKSIILESKQLLTRYFVNWRHGLSENSKTFDSIVIDVQRRAAVRNKTEAGSSRSDDGVGECL